MCLLFVFIHSALDYYAQHITREQSVGGSLLYVQSVYVISVACYCDQSVLEDKTLWIYETVVEETNNFSAV